MESRRNTYRLSPWLLVILQNLVQTWKRHFDRVARHDAIGEKQLTILHSNEHCNLQ